MKKPKFKDLKIDAIQTKKIKKMMDSTDKIKITICLDRDSVDSLKRTADKTGAKYQTLLNRILKEHLASNKDETQIRLNKLESEVERLKMFIKKAA